ncbi:glycoside hydrolase family 43 protein [Paenibacillus sp. GD4]|uniref:glycoside hydrolase family 43 protein n=1 Tax=Paenibacillus sp. GD4 TaxID=3068890 RepID=UPI00279685AC|nr:glycoside hydrolase family 43 protein [Paenibacillus sp. GD4]MDQ1913225.1 glycoside hydrolase family 43 protein [Paenibacillus sp. GD4]
MLRTSEIRVRDPFVLPVPEEKAYYLFGTTDDNVWDGAAEGFNVYRSTDLEQWEGPFPAFRPEAGFWADRHFWAPEVHLYQSRYYMLASFKAEGQCRGTQVLLSESGPQGPYAPVTNGPVTPRDWECLDGTLYVDKEGKPWMVFCREWLQVQDGEMYAMPLREDLSAASGEPALLFKASSAPWSRPVREVNYVTDGPFLWEDGQGSLLMLWSSIGSKGYAMGIARSASEDILGPWVQEEKPFFAEDGGHGMLFRALDGALHLAVHTPNKSPNERAVFIPMKPESLV